MYAEERIQKAIESCKRALENLEKGSKRKALGDLDFAADRINGAKWILINEIEESEGGL